MKSLLHLPISETPDCAQLTAASGIALTERTGMRFPPAKSQHSRRKLLSIRILKQGGGRVGGMKEQNLVWSVILAENI